MQYAGDLSVTTLLSAFGVLRQPLSTNLYTAPQLYEEICSLCGCHGSPLLHCTVAAVVECFYSPKYVGPICYLR
jgi:hypothetical protein